jgi:hypothetical protein
MWYQISQLSQQSAFCFHLTTLWQMPHGHRVILFLFCWFVGFVELFIFMLVGGNKLLLGTCTSLLLLMVSPNYSGCQMDWVIQVVKWNGLSVSVSQGTP